MSVRCPLRLLALNELPYQIRRSAFRWSVSDGHRFRKGDLLGFCNLGFGGEHLGQGDLSGPLEGHDLQLALIARTSGALHHVSSIHGGGWSDRQPWYLLDPHSEIATVELAPDDAEGAHSELLDYHFVTGRRAASLAEDRSGLATGWHDRQRAWRLARTPHQTVLGLGSCELFDTLRGEQGAFIDLLDGASSNIHVVDVPERPIIHSARMIVEQMRRTDEDRAALEDVFRSAIIACPPGDSGLDWSFALFAMKALKNCPVLDRYEILTGQGVESVGPASAVILSIGSEQVTRLRHRRLGFMLDCRTFLYSKLSQAMKEWLQNTFELVRHPVDDVKQDYLRMVRELRRRNPGLGIMVLNAVSTRGSEDILTYAPYDEPMGLQLPTVRAREMNAMLHDIQREADIAIVDSDAIAAHLGCAIAIPDGVHQNGEMQLLLRQEIRSILGHWQDSARQQVRPPRR